jgi:hypothetical protein
MVARFPRIKGHLGGDCRIKLAQSRWRPCIMLPETRRRWNADGPAQTALSDYTGEVEDTHNILEEEPTLSAIGGASKGLLGASTTLKRL